MWHLFIIFNVSDSRYRIGVFNGVRLFAGLYTVGIEVCGLFFCRDNTLGSCGDRFPIDAKVIEPTTFHEVSITRTIDNDPQKFYLPMTLTKSLLPINALKIDYEERLGNGQKPKTLKMTLKRQESSLMAFAIYGRNLGRDGSPLTTPQVLDA